MDALRKVYSEPHECNRRLAELGLEEEWLRQAVQTGQLQRLSCTQHHPIPYAGHSAWAETIRTLRDILVPKGWHSQDQKGLPLVVNSSETLAITVATGDQTTGKCDGEDPCTKSPKGPQTKSAVSVNQLSLFPTTEIAKAFNVPRRGSITWLLLIHSDWQAREVRCELSLPVGMSDEGRVDGWEERIILGSTPFDADELEVPEDDAPQSPDIVVEVKRRA